MYSLNAPMTTTVLHRVTEYFAEAISFAATHWVALVQAISLGLLLSFFSEPRENASVCLPRYTQRVAFAVDEVAL